MRFKYKLEGFDKEWVDAGTRRFAYYASLPPGHYTFKVIAGHLDGPWNEKGQFFAFYLKPRFYQTPLFLVLVIASVLMLGGLLYRLRMVELKARYLAVLGERNRIAREIHDTLAQNLAGIACSLIRSICNRLRFLRVCVYLWTRRAIWFATVCLRRDEPSLICDLTNSNKRN